MVAKTAFELYLEANPSKRVEGDTAPVVYFEANTTQKGMADFRPVTVPADAPDPDGYREFIMGDGFMVNPKGPLSATASAPTSPELREEEQEALAAAERARIEVEEKAKKKS